MGGLGRCDMAKGRTKSAKICTKCGETDVDGDGGGKSEDGGYITKFAEES